MNGSERDVVGVIVTTSERVTVSVAADSDAITVQDWVFVMSFVAVTVAVTVADRDERTAAVALFSEDTLMEYDSESV